MSPCSVICPLWVLLYWKLRCFRSLTVEETEPLYAIFPLRANVTFLAVRNLPLW
jgi:hypothetical protein